MGCRGIRSLLRFRRELGRELQLLGKSEEQGESRVAVRFLYFSLVQACGVGRDFSLDLLGVHRWN
jgi:hypothetical protein